MFTRREFIKAGLAGGLLFAALRAVPSAATEDEAPRDQRDALFAALIPVFLAGAIPESGGARIDAITKTQATLRKAIAGLAPASQAELGELFRLLSIAPLRWLLTGIASWERATPEAVEKFLSRWRNSLWTLPQSGYQALTQLTLAAWYGNADSWPAIGYAGPPQFERT